MTDLLFLKFNLASPLATDANVRMSKPDESSRNYHVQFEIVLKHDSRPGSPPSDLWGLTRLTVRAAADSNSFVFTLSRWKFTYWVPPIKLMDLCRELNWEFILIFTLTCTRFKVI